MTQLGLNIKSLKNNIRSSESTLYEKLVLDRKTLETEEGRACFNILLLIKQKLELDSVNRGEIDEEDRMFDDLEKFTVGGTVFNQEDEVAKSLSKLVNQPFRRKNMTRFDKMRKQTEADRQAD